MMRSLLVTLSAVLAFAAPAVASGLNISDTAKTVSGIEHYYNGKALFKDAKCIGNFVGETYFVVCGPEKSMKSGALWALENGPSILAVNKIAIKQARRMGKTITTNNERIIIKDWKAVHPIANPNTATVVKSVLQ